MHIVIYKLQICNIKKRWNLSFHPCFFLYVFYIPVSGAIALTGQSAAHVPHEIHFDGSITHFPSAPTEIAHTGHAPMHV